LSEAIHHSLIKIRASLQAIMPILVRASGVVIGKFVQQNTMKLYFFKMISALLKMIQII
jgi:hypothetical protein